jgi:hypothetical protein
MWQKQQILSEHKISIEARHYIIDLIVKQTEWSKMDSIFFQLNFNFIFYKEVVETNSSASIPSYQPTSPRTFIPLL